MAVNKVEINGEVKLDLTQDTVSEDTLLQGITAHDAAGNPIEGKVITTPIPVTEDVLKGDGRGGIDTMQTIPAESIDIPVGIFKGTASGSIEIAIPGTDYMTPIAVTSADNGKVATVMNGVWSAKYPASYSPFSGASASAAGSVGLVPSPKKGQQNRYLKGDGTWADVLPQVDASDNGKFLQVVSGAWAAVSISDAHGGIF